MALTARAFPLGVWTHTPRDGEELLERVPSQARFTHRTRHTVPAQGSLAGVSLAAPGLSAATTGSP